MRLPNGYGSIYKLSGNRRKPWCVRKTTGWKDNGQPIYTFIGYYPTRQEALTALADYNKDPYDLQLSSVTFADLYERWSEEHFQKISHSGVNSYSSAYRSCEKISSMRVVDIKLDHLQQAMDDSGKNSPTLKTMKNLFGLMYDYAVVHEIITPDKREMIRYLDTSKPGNPNKMDRKIFTHKEIQKLWEMICPKWGCRLVPTANPSRYRPSASSSFGVITTSFVVPSWVRTVRRTSPPVLRDMT